MRLLFSKFPFESCAIFTSSNLPEMRLRKLPVGTGMCQEYLLEALPHSLILEACTRRTYMLENSIPCASTQHSTPAHPASTLHSLAFATVSSFSARTFLTLCSLGSLPFPHLPLLYSADTQHQFSQVASFTACSVHKWKVLGLSLHSLHRHEL